MTGVVASAKGFSLVKLLEDSGIQWYSGFKRCVPERDLLLRLQGGVEAEQPNECALAQVAHVSDLRFASAVRLRVPDSVSLVQSRETGGVDNIGGRRRTGSFEEAWHGDTGSLRSVGETVRDELGLYVPCIDGLENSGVMDVMARTRNMGAQILRNITGK